MKKLSKASTGLTASKGGLNVNEFAKELRRRGIKLSGYNNRAKLEKIYNSMQNSQKAGGSPEKNSVWKQRFEKVFGVSRIVPNKENYNKAVQYLNSIDEQLNHYMIEPNNDSIEFDKNTDNFEKEFSQFALDHPKVGTYMLKKLFKAFYKSSRYITENKEFWTNFLPLLQMKTISLQLLIDAVKEVDPINYITKDIIKKIRDSTQKYYGRKLSNEDIWAHHNEDVFLAMKPLSMLINSHHHLFVDDVKENDKIILSVLLNWNNIQY